MTLSNHIGLMLFMHPILTNYLSSRFTPNFLLFIPVNTQAYFFVIHQCKNSLSSLHIFVHHCTFCASLHVKTSPGSGIVQLSCQLGPILHRYPICQCQVKRKKEGNSVVKQHYNQQNSIEINSLTSSGSINLNSRPRPVQAIREEFVGLSRSATRNCHSWREPRRWQEWQDVEESTEKSSSVELFPQNSSFTSSGEKTESSFP